MTIEVRPAEANPATRFGLLAALSLAVSALLLVPDFYLARSGLALDGATRPKFLFLVAAVALVLTSMSSRRARLWTLAFLVVNQVIWTGCAVYFGKALGPEQLLLARYEVGDTISGALAEWRSLLPAVALVLASGFGVAALQWPQFEGRVWRSPYSVWALLIGIVGASAFWSLHKRIEVAFPGKHTPSIYGPFQAAVSALRMASTSVSASAGMQLVDQSVTAAPMDKEPVTVVVIMGESINAYRLSVFGFGEDTTPGLTRWLTAPPAGFELIAKIGISGGTATFGSVPSFLRMAYLPVDAQRIGLNLFDLADRQGFKTWFLSAQHRQFLDAAGGAKNAVRIETDHGNGNEAKLEVIHDDMILEFVRQVPADAEKRFIFLHQRVNHAGYTVHCRHAPDGMYIFEDKTGTTAGVRRAAYDNGLRCWDRSVTSLAQEFVEQKGAVHIFIMADHSELMGEAGLWGHGMPDVHAAMVPMMLLTNRPASPVATMFKEQSPPTTYRMAQTVARALGLEISTPGISKSRFYLNSTMPFALAGFMEVDHAGKNAFNVSTYARNGKLLGTKSLDLPELTSGRVSNDTISHTAGAGAAAVR